MGYSRVMTGSRQAVGVLVAASLGLAACGSGSHASTSVISNPSPPPAGNHFEARVQATLLRTCEIAAGGTKAAVVPCGCALAHLEARVSQKTLQATEQAIVAGKATVPQWLRNATNGCPKEKRSASPSG
jgi:hypothetical protein